MKSRTVMKEDQICYCVWPESFEMPNEWIKYEITKQKFQMLMQWSKKLKAKPITQKD